MASGCLERSNKQRATRPVTSKKAKSLTLRVVARKRPANWAESANIKPAS